MPEKYLSSTGFYFISVYIINLQTNCLVVPGMLGSFFLKKFLKLPAKQRQDEWEME